MMSEKQVKELEEEVERWKAIADTYMLEALTSFKHFVDLRKHMEQNYIHKDNVQSCK